MDQQTFLRLAKRELGLSYPRLAEEIGVSPRTLEKWALGVGSRDHREMPRIAWKSISRLLEERKRAQILAGDRATAEAIDAIVAHVSPDRLREALRAFVSLQRSANLFVPMSTPRDRPGYFRTQAEKNAWNEQDELRSHIEEREVEGVKIRVLDIEGMLMSKDTDRPEDIPDRKRLSRLRP